MIPNTGSKKEVVSGGVSETGMFSISQDDEAHIMTILRDTLYSDKVSAVLREYGSNAWDSHRVCGKGHIPISVTVPTYSDPKLSIRDFGPGLSKEGIFTIYTRYGSSTKREDNEAVGMLGIGSKSGFAYSDSFTITSWNGGTKSIYVAALDKSDKGIVNLLHEEPCGDETGIQIEISVNPADIQAFQQRARSIYSRFSPRPNINIEYIEDETSNPEYVLPSGQVFRSDRYRRYSYDNHWIAQMGCVCYPLDLGQVYGKVDIPNAVLRISGLLNFEVGEIQVSASRESLKYGEATNSAVIKKMDKLIQELLDRIHGEIERDGLTWGSRLKAQTLNDLGMGGDVGVFSSSISLGDCPEEISFTYKKSTDKLSYFSVQKSACICIQDVLVGTRGNPKIDDRATVVRINLPKTKSSIAQNTEKAISILEKYLEEKGMVGIPVTRMSSLDDCSTAKRPRNTQRNSTIYKLNFSRNQRSEKWEPVPDHVPSKEDVFVLLKRYQAGNSFIFEVSDDARLLSYIGATLPDIYGYNGSAGKKLDASSIPGINYYDWRKKIRADVLKNNKDMVRTAYLSSLKSYSYSLEESGKVLLPEDHPLAKFYLEVSTACNKRASTKNSIFENIVWILSKEEFGAELKALIPDVIEEKERLFNKYPLLSLAPLGLEELVSNNAKLWTDYVSLVDKSNKE